MSKKANPSLVPLVIADQEFKLHLHKEGASIIQDFTSFQITFITLTGFKEMQSQVGHSLMKSQAPEKQEKNCLWIRPEPIYNQKVKKCYFFLECEGWDPQARQLLHLLACTISYVTFAVVQEYDDISYLSNISNLTNPDKGLVSHQIKQKFTELICLLPDPNGSLNLEERTDKFFALLQERGILDDVVSIYPQVKCYGVSEQGLISSSQQIQNKLLEEIETVSIRGRNNQELMYGPIITEFINNIIYQINQTSQVDLERAEDDIEIQPAYNAYMEAIDRYHGSIMTKLTANEKPSIEEVEGYLSESRKDAFDQFYRHEQDFTPKYRELLQDYIEKKENELKEMYNDTHTNKNLQILEVESNEALQDIKKNAKNGQNTEYIKQRINKMVDKYLGEAKGPAKHQILSDYLKVFCPLAYQKKGSRKELDELKKMEKKNKELKKKLQILQRQNQSKCCVLF